MNEEAEIVRRYRVERIDGDGARTELDPVSVDRVGAETLAVTMRTPGHDFELGFLRDATFNVYSGAQRLEPPGSAR